MSNTKADLSPCRFCGASPRLDKKSGHVGTTRTRYYREAIVCKCGMNTDYHKAPGKAVKLWNRRPAHQERGMAGFQDRVAPWMLACFGEAIAGDRTERNHRFLEEALELVQATGCTKTEAHQLVDYVYGRPTGEPNQEVGGVMVTLAALCLANNALDMHEAGETELARIWTKVEQIRAKQAAKPKHSPLPGPTTSEGAAK